MDKILTLNALDYFNVVKTAYQNAGTAVPKNIYGDPSSPSVPAYIWPNDGKGQSCTAAGPTCTTVVDPASYKYPSNLIMPGSPGTNWWKAVFGSGQYRDANIAVSGGGEDNAYHVSSISSIRKGRPRITGSSGGACASTRRSTWGR